MQILLSLVLTLLAVCGVTAQPAPSIRLVPYVTGLNLPLAFVDDGSGRCFVVEQDGLIRRIANDQAQSIPFLDLRDRVSRRGNECGLLGLVFHPKFATNGRFFVNYTSLLSGHMETIVSEFKARPGSETADPKSERVLLRFDQPFDNHNGGCLQIGPDGMLYISTGDGGSGGDPKGNGQNLNTLLAKILRIDVDHGQPYGIPSDNPFAKKEGARAEVWAWGLRNPWRFSFDRTTKQLYAGDVGQNKWEEIDLIEKGKNYGWSAREGTHDFSPERKAGSELTEPIKDYGRDLGQSVTGGYVYRGKENPSLAGVYVYADYQTGRIWGLKWDGHALTFDAELLHPSMLISSFGEDHTGELYVCDHRAGKIWRIAP